MVSSRLPTPLSFPRGVELCRNPATGGESSCHHLAARLVGASCCRTSSAPNKKMKSFDSLVATVLLILNGHSGSSPSPSPSPPPPPPSPSPPPPFPAGYLVKQSKQSPTTWQRRWFILRRQNLIYSKGVGTKILNSINMSGYTVLHCLPPEQRRVCPYGNKMDPMAEMSE